MDIFLLKSKIHRATVTGGDVNYEGSLTISADLMEKCGLQEYEKILCGNMANGNRWETYVIKGKRGTGEIIMNGAVAHLGKKGRRADHHELRHREPEKGEEVETAGHRPRQGEQDCDHAGNLILSQK
jgi:aspartate 1-decarboxylase